MAAADPPGTADLSGPDARTPPPHGIRVSDGAEFLSPPRAAGELGWLAHYRVRKRLGAGGMGLVFLADDTFLERPVALKVMQPALAADPANRDRFLREARAAAQLTHDHVVTIHQVGEANGAPFLAMQLLQGESLDDYLARGRKLSYAHVCRVGREVAAGLAAAHDRGLIHRDVKPANLWLEAPKGRVKILDFGLARPAGDAKLTTSGMVLGTPAYMAPEQARGQPLDARCDLWSLGVVLYRLCTGRLPFHGADVIAVATAIALDEPPPVRDLAPDVPPPLAELVHQLLSKDRDKRPATALDVAGRLHTIERGLLKAARTPPAARPAPPADDATAPATTAPAPRPRRRKVGLSLAPGRWRVGLTLALGAALALVGGGLLLHRFVTTPDGDEYPLAAAAAPKGGVTETTPPTPPVVTGWTSRGNPVPDFKVGSAGNIAALVAFTDGGKTLLVVDGEHVSRRPVAGGPWDRTPLAAECRRRYAAEPRRSALSADGKRLALGLWAVPGGSHRLLVWDVDSRQPADPGTPPETDRPINGLAFGPDGRSLVTTDDTAARVWTVTAAHPTRGATFPVRGGYAVAVSPDGATRAGGTEDGVVRLIDSATGRLRWPPHTPAAGQRVDGVVFSPDGTRLAVNTVRHGTTVYDTATGAVVATIDGGNHQPAFSPDGQLLALCAPGGAAEPRGVTIFDLAANRTAAVSAREHTGWIVCLAWGPDGTTLASLGNDDTLRLWDVPRPLLPAAP